MTRVTQKLSVFSAAKLRSEGVVLTHIFVNIPFGRIQSGYQSRHQRIRIKIILVKNDLDTVHKPFERMQQIGKRVLQSFYCLSFIDPAIIILNFSIVPSSKWDGSKRHEKAVARCAA